MLDPRTRSRRAPLIALLATAALISALATAPSALAKVKGFTNGVASGDVGTKSAILWGQAKKSGKTVLQVTQKGGFGKCKPKKAKKKYVVKAKGSTGLTVQTRVKGPEAQQGLQVPLVRERRQAQRHRQVQDGAEGQAGEDDPLRAGRRSGRAAARLRPEGRRPTGTSSRSGSGSPPSTTTSTSCSATRSTPTPRFPATRTRTLPSRSSRSAPPMRRTSARRPGPRPAARPPTTRTGTTTSSSTTSPRRRASSRTATTGSATRRRR